MLLFTLCVFHLFFYCLFCGNVNSLHLIYLGMSLLPLYYLNMVLLDGEFLIDTLTMLFFWLLPSIVCDKSALNCIFSLYGMKLAVLVCDEIFFVVFGIFSLSLSFFFLFLAAWLWCFGWRFLSVYVSWCWTFICRLLCFIKFEELSAINFFSLLLSLFLLGSLLYFYWNASDFSIGLSGSFLKFSPPISPFKKKF